MSNLNPSVSIAIPAFNEENYIEGVLNTFCSNFYPNIVEVLVADGGSTDSTRALITAYSKKDPRVKLIHNPERVQSFGLNHMIDVAKGEIFLRADAHAIYADDYVELSVRTLISSGAKNVGGAQRFIALNTVQAGIAIAVKSPFGSGGASYRSDVYSGKADTVFLGCFWLEDLKKIGGFRTDNGVNEDSELNLRLLQLSENPVYISQDIIVHYLPRNSIQKLARQYYRYGRSRYITTLRHPENSKMRGQIPFYVSVFFSLYLSIDVLVAPKLFALEIIGAFVTILFLHTAYFVTKIQPIFKTAIWKKNLSDRPSVFTLIPITFSCIIVMSISHSIGFFHQMLRRMFLGEKKWIAT
jgi:succinoglycan biosynthesis protein ExoA